AWKLFDDGV
uniref:Anticancerous peptide 1 n=1 Tax=Cycas revoluta TaxID=3396 RepID=ACP1_CYCRE|nr:RecName: Full=Anticancerous peptide 1; Short=Cr-ACP1 [Cycas revoluta]